MVIVECVGAGPAAWLQRVHIAAAAPGGVLGRGEGGGASGESVQCSAVHGMDFG